MPQAVLAAAGAAATYVSGAVYSGLTAVGVSAGTAALVSTYAASITALTVTAIAYVGPSILFAPKIPTPDYARSVKKQAIPDRVSGYGRARIGGPYMLYEIAEDDDRMAINVFALHDGLVDEIEEIYLNDRPVTVLENTFVQHDADLRYSKNDDLVRIETRRGHPIEVNYSAVTAISPGYWPSNARLDGVASLMMIAQATEEHFVRDYPNGLPQPSTVARLQLCWDPRLGARGTITDDDDKEASATWAWTQNPFLQLLDYMTNPETGMGLPLARFLPVISTWIAAANACDEPVTLAAGGTVPRYRSGGTYLHSTAPADVIATILASCDGWMAEDENGCFVVEAGKFYEPDVVLTDAHIISLSRQFYQPDEQAVNEIVASFTDPTKDFTEVETDPWRLEDEIDAMGGVVRSQRLSLPWVQDNSQARRLAKIALYKAATPLRGTVTVTLEGLKAWGKRRIRIQAPEDSATMADVVVDCLPLSLNADMTVTIPWVLSVPEAYDWDAETEEGAGSGDVSPPPLSPVGVPEIDQIDVFQTESGATRLRVFFDTTTAGQTYVVRWRVTGEDSWTSEAAQVSVVGIGFPFVETGLVTPAELDVSALVVSPSGAKSEWSPTTNVDASISTAMGKPTNFVASGIGTTEFGASIDMSAQAPVYDDVSYLVFYRGSGPTFGVAVDISGEVPVASGDFANYSYIPSAGDHYIWVQAFDISDVGSGPLGPIKVTIPA